MTLDITEHPTEIDKYHIIKHLGSGFFGDVYQAHDRALDAIKAIKVLDIKEPDKFLLTLEEAQILNKCRHKNIVEVNEANLYQLEEKQIIIIDMELIEGCSLEDRLQSGFVSAVDARNYLIDVLFGLEHAHNQNILHRDIKPGNILIGKNAAKLSDFGLATALGGRQFGSPKGYITHLAPETFQTSVTSVATDIYAVGITFFRVVTNISDWKVAVGKLKDPEKTIKNGNLINHIECPQYVPAKIKRIINKACNKDPKKRYSSASKMRQALEALKPSINWVKINKNNWQGSEWQRKDQYEAKIISKKVNKVTIKKNGRKIGQLCKSYETEEEAVNYLKAYLANSKFK